VSEIINLKRALKAKERAGREQAAAENRRIFGRTKAEKLAEKAEKERAARTLRNHLRSDGT
jgi:hypothetical protein